jgi:hypothetical protein
MIAPSWIRKCFGLSATRPIRKVPRCARPAFEALEDRTVPTVSVTGSGATLNITDNDTTLHSIIVEQTATQGTFTVQIDSGATATFAGVKQIKVNLGADSDYLSFQNSSNATTNLGGNLSVTAGNGNCKIIEGFFAILGNVSITEGNGLASTTIADTSINGNVSLTQGDARTDAVDVQGSVSIGGNLSISQGNGEVDQVLLIDTNTVIGGNLSVTQGNGALNQVFLVDTNTVIGGNLSVTVGDGTASRISIDETTVAGNTSLQLGDGIHDFIDIDETTVAGNTSLQLGDGIHDFIDIGTDGTGSSVTFAKNVSINFGKGGSAILNIGTTDIGMIGATSDSVYFGGHATFIAGGSGNSYHVGDFVFFLFDQPSRHNI